MRISKSRLTENRNICPFRFSGLSSFSDRFSYFLVVSHCPRANCKCKCEYRISVCGSNSYIRCACALRSSTLHCWKCCLLSRRLWLLLCLIPVCQTTESNKNNNGRTSWLAVHLIGLKYRAASGICGIMPIRILHDPSPTGDESLH